MVTDECGSLIFNLNYRVDIAFYYFLQIFTQSICYGLRRCLSFTTILTASQELPS